MGFKVVWTRRAETGYDKIIRYLLQNWSEKEVKAFILETRYFISMLENNPRLLEMSTSRKNLFRGPLNRLTIITYRVKPRLKIIELLNIRSALKRPLL
jgi:plasmid stabilization system protein ParE